MNKDLEKKLTEFRELKRSYEISLGAVALASIGYICSAYKIKTMPTNPTSGNIDSLLANTFLTVGLTMFAGGVAFAIDYFRLIKSNYKSKNLD